MPGPTVPFAIETMTSEFFRLNLQAIELTIYRRSVPLSCDHRGNERNLGERDARFKQRPRLIVSKLSIAVLGYQLLGSMRSLALFLAP